MLYEVFQNLYKNRSFQKTAFFYPKMPSFEVNDAVHKNHTTHKW